MSDPLRTDGSHATDPASDADREAKIEQLLLAGLDHYFSARYEDAINIWTRALFFDRSHARARAYIERARSAAAERQRESEEILQNGVAAFQRGEAEEARRLLQAAMDQGAPPEEALAILDRLNRLEQGASRPVVSATPGTRSRPFPLERLDVGVSRTAWIALTLLVLVILAAGVFAAATYRSDWRLALDRPAAAPATVGRPPAEDGPSLPRRGEIALARAQALASAGRLLDALAALDLVKPTDAEKPEADRLRADLQRQLITLGAMAPPDASAARGDVPAP